MALVSWSCHVRTADDHLRIAGELEAQGRPDSALYHLDEAVRKDGEHLWARIDRARLRSNNGDNKGAIADNDTVLVIDPMNQTALFNRAMAKARSRDHTGAIQDLETVLRWKSPGWGGNEPGNVHVFIEATDNPGMGIKTPDHAVPYEHVVFELAMNYLELDSATKAYDRLSESIEIGFEVALCLYERGILLIRHGHHQEGCSDLEQAAIQRHGEARKAWTRHCAGSTTK